MGKWMILARVSLGLTVCLAGASRSAGAADVDPADARDAPYAQAEQLVDVDHGRRLNLYCVGQGSPTVIFDAGLGGNTASWDTVQPVIAQHTRTCSYDRAGLGSAIPLRDPAPAPTPWTICSVSCSPPASSRPTSWWAIPHGGMDVRLYAYGHSADVVGMVLVDPSS